MKKKYYVSKRRKALPKRRFKKRTSVTGNSEIVKYRPNSFIHMPLPPRFRTKVIASGFFYTSSGGGSGDYNLTFDLNTCNSCFNFTNTGITWNTITVANYEPAGFSQLCNSTLYRQYRVLGSSITCDITPQSVVDTVSCSLLPSSDLNVPANLAVALAQPYSKSHNMAANRAPATLRNYITQHKFLGVSRSAIQNDLSGNYNGSYSSGPVVPLYWKLLMETGDNQTLSAAVEVRIKIVYYLEFFGLTNPALTE